MSPPEHRSFRDLLGPYVLGQLPAAERSAVADHVGGCAACQADVADLEPAARLLRGVRAARPVVIGAAPSPDLADRIIAQTRPAPPAPAVHSRRRIPLAAQGLAVAASLAVAFLLGSQLGPLSRPDAPVGATGSAPAAPPVEDLQVQTVAAGVQASAGLVTHTWGTEVKLVAEGLADGGTYQVSIVADDGTVVAAGTFLGTGDNPVRCSLNAALTRDTATSVQVTDAEGLVVLAADAT